MPKVVAQAIAIVAGTPLSFLGQKLWSFQRVRRSRRGRSSPCSRPSPWLL